MRPGGKQETSIVTHLGFIVAALVLQGCGQDRTESQSMERISTPDTRLEEPIAAGTAEASDGMNLAELEIDASDFKCLQEMKSVRHFFVDNLLGDLGATVAIAESTVGGVYPPGSVVQLVPTEVMVKHRPGWNAATRDWEFFELDVSAQGSRIRNRGFVDVVNRFGGNCFGCHIKAEPKYDLICERDHGCDDIPITREAIATIQAEDPRCAS